MSIHSHSKNFSCTISITSPRNKIPHIKIIGALKSESISDTFPTSCETVSAGSNSFMGTEKARGHGVSAPPLSTYYALLPRVKSPFTYPITTKPSGIAIAKIHSVEVDEITSETLAKRSVGVELAIVNMVSFFCHTTFSPFIPYHSGIVSLQKLFYKQVHKNARAKHATEKHEGVP